MTGNSSDSVEQDPVRESGDNLQPDDYQQYVDFFENAVIPMHWVGPDGTVLNANTAELDALGYDREEYVGLHIEDFHADQDVIDDILERLSSGEELRDYEARMVRKDGSIRHVLINSSVNWNDGEFVNTRCVTRDITERKEYKRELERQNDRLEEIYGRISDAFFALDEEWQFAHLNDQAHEVINPDGHELEGKNIWDAFPAATEREFKPKYEQAMYDQETVTFEEYYPDPLDAWFEVRAYPSETGLSVYFRDITERKKREQELVQYGTIIETIDDGVYIVDEENRFVMVNDAYVELFGYDREELLGAPASLIGGEDVAEEARHLEERMRRGTAEEPTIEAELPTVNGDRISVEAKFSLLSGAADQEYRIGVVRDISERKAHEQRIADREQTLRSVYEITADGDAAVSEQIEALLEVVRNYLGTDYATFSHIQSDRYEFERVSVASGIDLQAGHTTDRIEFPICEQVFETGEPLVINDVAAEAPELVDPEWGIACYLGAPAVVDGTPYGTFCFYDVEPRAEEFSEWDQTFVELLSDWVGSRLTRQQTTEQLQQQNEQLEEFASIVSHDLRNPLNVAEGRLELAQGECESEHLEEIEKAHTRMDALIEDLLTLAREGDEVTEYTRIDLSTLIDNCWATVETGNATLATNIDRTVLADQSRLKQIFENLIRNAVEHGQDDVTVTVGGLENGFYIEDDGPGIPQERRDDVFEAGYSTSKEGTGFGLSIVKQVVGAHGWNVGVTAGSNGGARFEFTGVEFSAD